MSGPTRSKEQRELDRVTVARMRLEGKTQYEIAQAIGVTRPQIIYDLKLIKDQWRSAYIEDTATHIAREVARLEHIEEEAWACYRRSLRPTKQAKDGRDGRAEFLQIALNCSSERRKLLGLDQPTRIDITAKLREEAQAAGLDPDSVIAAAQDILAGIA